MLGFIRDWWLELAFAAVALFIDVRLFLFVAFFDWAWSCHQRDELDRRRRLIALSTASMRYYAIKAKLKITDEEFEAAQTVFWDGLTEPNRRLMKDAWDYGAAEANRAVFADLGLRP